MRNSIQETNLFLLLNAYFCICSNKRESNHRNHLSSFVPNLLQGRNKLHYCYPPEIKEWKPKTSTSYHQLHGLDYCLSFHNITRFKTDISRNYKKICCLSTTNLNERASQSEQNIPKAPPASANLCKIICRDYSYCCRLEHWH